MSDPKLKQARAQITALCKKLDIAGHFVLHNAPSDIEIFFTIAPSYSKVRIDIEPGGAEVRLTSHASEYGGDRAAQMRDLKATANMVSSLAEALDNHAQLFAQASRYVDAQLGAYHGELEKTEPPEGQGVH